jgi:hypothetical protein
VAGLSFYRASCFHEFHSAFAEHIQRFFTQLEDQQLDAAHRPAAFEQRARYLLGHIDDQ